MPKINLDAISVEPGSGYPAPFDSPCAQRLRQRHWHSHEDEFVYVLAGELTLVEDMGPTVLRAGDCAGFPKGTGNGHHLQNSGGIAAVYLEIGSRQPDDLATCSDIDLMSYNSDGKWRHKDGTAYS
ncbi:MAG: cupin domain-containing protein [Steroidobacteraceae bacterium]